LVAVSHTPSPWSKARSTRANVGSRCEVVTAQLVALGYK
jgi:hypothetical protein